MMSSDSCAPSRTSLMTGCRPDTVQRYGEGPPAFYDRLRERVPGIATIPELYRGEGYRVVSLHKVMHEYDRDPTSWETQWWATGGEPPSWCPDDHDCIDRARRYKNEASRELMRERFERLTAADPDAADQFKRWRGPAVESARVADDDYYPGETAAEAVRLFADHRRDGDDKPLFLGVGFCNTHLPWLTPERYWQLHDHHDFGTNAGFDTPVPGSDLPRAGNEPYQYFGQDDHIPGMRASWQPTREEARDLRHGYYAAISYLDAQIGRILDGLDAAGMRDNTIVVFTTDHGFAIGEHRHWGKMTVWEPDVRVPLMIRRPGAAAGCTPALTEHVDLMPTLFELTGVDTPDWAEGDSLVPVMDEPHRPWKAAAFSQIRRGDTEARTLTTGSHRYSWWTDAAGAVVAEQLYDHRADPAECTNLLADAATPDDPRAPNATGDSVDSEAGDGLIDSLRRLAAGGWKHVRAEVRDDGSADNRNT